MSQLPRESSNPRLRSRRAPRRRGEVPPTRSASRRACRRRPTVYDKSGQAYGFTTENACVVDPTGGRSFFLAATLYTNADGVLNDDAYDYATVALPFFAELGEATASYSGDGDRGPAPWRGRGGSPGASGCRLRPCCAAATCGAPAARWRRCPRHPWGRGGPPCREQPPGARQAAAALDRRTVGIVVPASMAFEARADRPRPRAARGDRAAGAGRPARRGGRHGYFAGTDKERATDVDGARECA